MRHPRHPTPAPAAAPPRFNVLAFLRDLAAPTTTTAARCAWCGAELDDPTSCALCGWQQERPDSTAAHVALPNYRAPWHYFLSLPGHCS